EDDPLARILRHAVDEPVSVADAFGRDDRALGVEAVEDIAESAPFLADEVFRRNLEILEEELRGVVADHGFDGAYHKPLADRIAQIDEKDRQTVGFLRRLRHG